METFATTQVARHFKSKQKNITVKRSGNFPHSKIEGGYGMGEHAIRTPNRVRHMHGRATSLIALACFYTIKSFVQMLNLWLCNLHTLISFSIWVHWTSENSLRPADIELYTRFPLKLKVIDILKKTKQFSGDNHARIKTS